MSEYAWIRMMDGIAARNPDSIVQLSQTASERFDRAQYNDHIMESERELVWRQAYLHQLAKVATGSEPHINGPLVQLFPIGRTSFWPLEPVFSSDMETLPMRAIDEDGKIVLLED